MTKLEKPLTRQTEILDDKGRELTVTMQPSDQGGEILLHWNRDKKKAGDRTFQLRDLSKGKVTQPQPKGWGTWVPIEQIVSQLTVAPGIGANEVAMFRGVMERAGLFQQWLSEDGDEYPCFEGFLADKGREDLICLPCDEERPEFKARREQAEELQKIRNQAKKSGDPPEPDDE